MEPQPARSEYKKVWSALSTTEDQAKLHVIGVTEEAALQSTGEETLRFLQDSVGIGKEPGRITSRNSAKCKKNRA